MKMMTLECSRNHAWHTCIFNYLHTVRTALLPTPIISGQLYGVGTSGQIDIALKFLGYPCVAQLASLKLPIVSQLHCMHRRQLVRANTFVRSDKLKKPEELLLQLNLMLQLFKELQEDGGVCYDGQIPSFLCNDAEQSESVICYS